MLLDLLSLHQPESALKTDSNVSDNRGLLVWIPYLGRFTRSIDPVVDFIRRIVKVVERRESRLTSTNGKPIYLQKTTVSSTAVKNSLIKSCDRLNGM